MLEPFAFRIHQIYLINELSLHYARISQIVLFQLLFYPSTFFTYRPSFHDPSYPPTHYYSQKQLFESPKYR